MSFNEIKNSINSVLYERVSSPFFGTFISSWLVINWKIIYLTFFVNESKIEGMKIDYIIKNYSNEWYIYIWPLISTLVLTTLIPFVSVGAYWLSLWFKDWMTKIRNKFELNQLLTIGQSIALRKQIRDQEKNIEYLLEEKNDQIEVLEKEIRIHIENDSLKPKNIELENIVSSDSTIASENREYYKIVESGRVNDFIKQLSKISKLRRIPRSDIPNLNNALALDLVAKDAGDTIYVKQKGHDLYKYVMLEPEFSHLLDEN